MTRTEKQEAELCKNVLEKADGDTDRLCALFERLSLDGTTLFHKASVSEYASLLEVGDVLLYDLVKEYVVDLVEDEIRSLISEEKNKVWVASGVMEMADIDCSSGFLDRASAEESDAAFGVDDDGDLFVYWSDGHGGFCSGTDDLASSMVDNWLHGVDLACLLGGGDLCVDGYSLDGTLCHVVAVDADGEEKKEEVLRSQFPNTGSAAAFDWVDLTDVIEGCDFDFLADEYASFAVLDENEDEIAKYAADYNDGELTLTKIEE